MPDMGIRSSFGFDFFQAVGHEWDQEKPKGEWTCERFDYQQNPV